MVFETIRSFLAEQLGCDEKRITESTVILQDLEAEASDLADLMLMLEQEYGIEWTDDDLAELETVGQVTAFVESQI
ncbi:MAG: acyl carrier protein [Faecousia sp.]|nr:acyl carrier protein [Bacillota bacterium]